MARRIWNIVGILLVLCALAAGGSIIAARSGWLARDDASVVAAYRRPNSRFLDVDGVRFHYLDEGTGPAIVLLHGSYLDLGIWDGWAAALRSTHRVIRIDRETFGTTALDPHGRYGYEREEALLGALVDRLGLTSFALVGASSAGTTAARYAARHPGRVDHLVLINFPLARRFVKPRPLYALSIWTRDTLLLNYQPGWQTRWILTSNLADPARATPEVVQRLTAETNRRGVLEARRTLDRNAGAYPEARRRADLAAIRAPALLIWGARNPLLSVESGREAFALVGAASKTMAVLPGASHMIPLEQSDAALALVQPFLDSPAAAAAARADARGVCPLP